MTLLCLTDVTIKYGAITAAREVNMSVAPGEVVGLIGPNGAGKTTTLGAIAGLLTPASGTIEYDGEDATATPADYMLRRGLALVPEHRRLFATLSVADNLRAGGATTTRSEREERMAEAVELFPVLERKWKTQAGYLSGGEAQQLAIARALMSDPKLLLMDEPSLGLAPTLVDVVFNLINDLRSQGRTLLVVEQNANRMLELADRAYVMRSGEIVAEGTGAELAERDDLFEEYVGGGS